MVCGATSAVSAAVAARTAVDVANVGTAVDAAAAGTAVKVADMGTAVGANDIIGLGVGELEGSIVWVGIS